MTTNKAASLGKSLKKDKRHKKIKKSRTKRRNRTKRNNNKSSSLSDLYTYESSVTNKADSLVKSNSNINNGNIVYGLKDFLAVKK